MLSCNTQELMIDFVGSQQYDAALQCIVDNNSSISWDKGGGGDLATCFQQETKQNK